MSDKTLVLRDADYVIQGASIINEKYSILIKGDRIVDVGPYEQLKADHVIDEEHVLAILPGNLVVGPLEGLCGVVGGQDSDDLVHVGLLRGRLSVWRGKT